MSNFSFALGIFKGISKAWFYLHTGDLARIRVQKATIRPPLLSEKELESIVERVDCIVERYIFWSRHTCFYRSLCILLVLRKLGYPLDLNVGLRNLQNSGNGVKGHCWLSLSDRLFYEDENTTHIYPHKLGVLNNGIVCWVQAGPDSTNDILRERLTS